MPESRKDSESPLPRFSGVIPEFSPSHSDVVLAEGLDNELLDRPAGFVVSALPVPSEYPFLHPRKYGEQPSVDEAEAPPPPRPGDCMPPGHVSVQSSVLREVDVNVVECVEDLVRAPGRLLRVQAQRVDGRALPQIGRASCRERV